MLLEAVLHRSLLQQACAPALGLWIAVLVLRRADSGNPLSPSTSEEYIRGYHDKSYLLKVLHLPFRLIAGIATVGLGGAAGLEGPAIYAERPRDRQSNGGSRGSLEIKTVKLYWWQEQQPV